MMEEFLNSEAGKILAPRSLKGVSYEEIKRTLGERSEESLVLASTICCSGGGDALLAIAATMKMAQAVEEFDGDAVKVLEAYDKVSESLSKKVGINMDTQMGAFTAELNAMWVELMCRKYKQAKKDHPGTAVAEMLKRKPTGNN